ncbi:hypothetical protein GGX14DRAFT_616875 [Mycena pura]|uniref:Uncharacterized protein n=1 Tax=Mycena pura TaxID=153505 RepID=A0AAD6YTX9_9AGAR|nr:hypothetical protein GGX14DRAFT_616875 [Mycena pura]
MYGVCTIPHPAPGYELKISSLFKLPHRASQGNFLLCPPLKILRTLMEEYDPTMMTMQEFLENIYAQDFPELLSLYHLVRNSPRAVPMFLGTGQVVTIGHEQFCLHNTRSVMLQELYLDQDSGATLADGSRSRWRTYPVINVPSDEHVPGKVHNGQCIPGDRLNDERILKGNKIVHEWLETRIA